MKNRRSPEAGPPRSLVRTASWAILAALLLWTLIAAATFDRDRWPYPVGDEATYQLQAESLGSDLDLAYEREDFDRYRERWQRFPDGLILQSRDGGEHLVYGKPFLYALSVAPFVRVAPTRGAAVANALFLALAAWLAAGTLERRLGDAAPLWVAVFLFASVAFVYVFWIHADSFLMSATAAAFALVYRHEHPSKARMPEIYDGDESESPGRWTGRWLVAGALLGLPASFRPFYLVLLLPAVLAVPKAGVRATSTEHRRRAIAALVGGALAVVALSGAAQWLSGGSFSPYGGERQGFYPRTGFPDVDFAREEWPESVGRWGNASWLHGDSFDFVLEPGLWGWNAIYFLAGRSVGVLPYFLPLLAGIFLFRRKSARSAILPAVVLGALAFFLTIPFNFFGGTGAIANRYFLPLYPALWFLASRPARARWAVVTAVAAAPFLWPLWSSPRAFLLEGNERYRHVSSVARRWLPYETTQSSIPGGRDTNRNGLWLKFLDPTIGPGKGGKLVLEGDGSLLVGSATPLTSVRLGFGMEAPGEIGIDGGVVGERLLKPDGGMAVTVELGRPRARHAMWWSREPLYLYELRLHLPRGFHQLRFDIEP